MKSARAVRRHHTDAQVVGPSMKEPRGCQGDSEGSEGGDGTLRYSWVRFRVCLEGWMEGGRMNTVNLGDEGAWRVSRTNKIQKRRRQCIERLLAVSLPINHAYLCNRSRRWHLPIAQVTDVCRYMCSRHHLPRTRVPYVSIASHPKHSHLQHAHADTPSSAPLPPFSFPQTLADAAETRSPHSHRRASAGIAFTTFSCTHPPGPGPGSRRRGSVVPT